jgi:DNA-binding transcriptional MerR regulator
MQSENKTAAFQLPAKLYRIGDLVRYTPFSRQTIHNYTTMGLIHEARWTEGGHRLYDESVFEKLAKILELKKTKTLYEIRQILGKEAAAFSGKKADRLQAKTTGGIARSENN